MDATFAMRTTDTLVFMFIFLSNQKRLYTIDYHESANEYPHLISRAARKSFQIFLLFSSVLVFRINYALPFLHLPLLFRSLHKILYVLYHRTE